MLLDVLDAIHSCKHVLESSKNGNISHSSGEIPHIMPASEIKAFSYSRFSDNRQLCNRGIRGKIGHEGEIHAAIHGASESCETINGSMTYASI